MQQRFKDLAKVAKNYESKMDRMTAGYHDNKATQFICKSLQKYLENQGNADEYLRMNAEMGDIEYALYLEVVKIFGVDETICTVGMVRFNCTHFLVEVHVWVDDENYDTLAHTEGY